MLRRSSQHPNIISCSPIRKRQRVQKNEYGHAYEKRIRCAKTSTNTEYENENGMRCGEVINLAISVSQYDHRKKTQTGE